MSGSLDFSIASTLAWVMPSCSPISMAWNDHLTMSNHWSSPWRTAGVKADTSPVAGKMTKSSGLAANQERRIVVEIRKREIYAVGVALQRPGGGARQHVDFAGLQRGEALLAGQGHELRLVLVSQHRGGNGPAGVDIEAAPITLRV